MSTSYSIELLKQEVYIQHSSNGTCHFQNKLLAGKKLAGNPEAYLKLRNKADNIKDPDIKKNEHKIVIIFSSIGLNMCFGCSKEQSH